MLTGIVGPVTINMLPVTQSDIESYDAPKVNFWIHILWICGFLSVTTSALTHYRRIFDHIFRDVKIGRIAKRGLWITVGFVWLWAIISVRVRQC